MAAMTTTKLDVVVVAVVVVLVEPVAVSVAETAALEELV